MNKAKTETKAEAASPVNALVSVPFSGEQLEIIGKAIEAFLVDDTVIVDENGKVHDEMTITLRNDAQGIRYYLGLEKNKPDYIKEAH